MNLHSIDVTHLSNLEASQFITLLFKDIDSVKVDISKDPEMDDRFQTLKTQGDAFYKAILSIRAMVQSQELEVLDLDRDHKIGTIRLHIAAFRYRIEPDIKPAFAAANIILNAFDGLESLNYEAESAGIHKFLDEWNKPENAVHVKALGLQLHLDNLKKAADAFDNVFQNRSGITLGKEQFDARALKNAMLKTYNSIAKYILAMVDFGKDENLYPPLLNAFNNGRKYFADLMAKRKGSGGSNDAADTPEDGK